MTKTLAVFGATGQQGGSIVNFVLNDAELSQQYNIRAITRDPSSTKAEALKAKGVDVVKADLIDLPSLQNALKDVHTVFALTASMTSGDVKAEEIAQGRAMADAAVASGAQYLIFSTLPHVSKISGGIYTKVLGFDAKAEVEEYIRTLPIKSAFFAPGSFMQNFQGNMKPHPSGDGEYMMTRHVSPQARLPLIDTAGDTGKFVGAILAEPDKYEGKIFCAATALYSNEEIARIISESSGKTVRYQQISQETFRQYLPFPDIYKDILVEMMLYQQDFGYYGPQTAELVTWAVENARGKVTTFEEYLAKNPLQFQ